MENEIFPEHLAQDESNLCRQAGYIMNPCISMACRPYVCHREFMAALMLWTRISFDACRSLPILRIQGLAVHQLYRLLIVALCFSRSLSIRCFQQPWHQLQSQMVIRMATVSRKLMVLRASKPLLERMSRRLLSRRPKLHISERSTRSKRNCRK